MSIRFDATGDHFYRTASTPSSTTWSASFWIYRIGTNPGFAVLEVIRGGTGNAYGTWAGLYLNNNVLRWDDTNGGASGSTIAANTWYHVAFAKNGTTVTVWLNGAQNISRSGAASPTAAGIAHGNVGNFGAPVPSPELFDGRLANLIIWSGVAITQEEAQWQRWFARPVVRLGSLWYWNPLVPMGAVTTDYSGQGNTMTTAGTITTEDQPQTVWAPRRRRVWATAQQPPVSASFGTLMLMGVGR